MDSNNCPDVRAITTITTDNDDDPKNPSQQQRKSSIASRDTMRTAKVHKRWNRRLKFLFCCLGYKKNKDSFADVASIFADFFYDLDSTSSVSLVAGFVTLAKFQKAQREWNVNNRKDDIYQYLSCLPISPKTEFLDVSEADDSHLVNDLIYYMNYSLAIFGWPLQMIDDPCMLCCIYPYLRISPCCGGNKRNNIKSKDTNSPDSGPKISKDQKQEKQAIPSGNQDKKSTRVTDNPLKISNSDTKGQKKPGQLAEDWNTPIIIDDNCCSCNVAAVERRLAVHNYEIIYVAYTVDVSRVPFLVAADHSKQTIVVAMRGSMSLQDVVTDMNGQIDKLPIKNCPDDWLCHRGISRAANNVKAKLIEDGILERAFNCRPDLGSQDYRIILCGHSLGAGTAAILGILLHKQYPTLKAYLYSPPGGILSLPVVEYTKQFAISIILGNDCVPSLGVAQFERLRYHVFLSLKNTPQSPGKIIAKTFCPCCCSKRAKIEYNPDASLDLLQGLNCQTFEYGGTKIAFQAQPHLLYVPGRILHIVKNYSLQSRATRLFKGPIYQAIWVDNTHYDRIMIANGMFCDHLPNNLLHAMKMLFVNTLPVRKNSKTPRPILVSSDDTARTMNSSSLIKQPKHIYPRITIEHTNHHNDEKHNVIEEQLQKHIDNNNNSNNNNNNIVDYDAKAFEDNQIINDKLYDEKEQFDHNGNNESTLNRNHVQLDRSRPPSIDKSELRDDKKKHGKK